MNRFYKKITYFYLIINYNNSIFRKLININFYDLKLFINYFG